MPNQTGKNTAQAPRANNQSPRPHHPQDTRPHQRQTISSSRRHASHNPTETTTEPDPDTLYAQLQNSGRPPVAAPSKTAAAEMAHVNTFGATSDAVDPPRAHTP